MPKQAGFATASQQPILLYSAPLLQPRGSAFSNESRTIDWKRSLRTGQLLPQKCRAKNMLVFEKLTCMAPGGLRASAAATDGGLMSLSMNCWAVLSSSP